MSDQKEPALRLLTPPDIRYLVVHCSDTARDCASSASDIHAMHLGFGWHGIGYHKVICRDGLIEAGRPEYWVGAHVYGFNEVSLGVCLLGKDTFTSAQFDSLEALLRRWRRRYPVALICGHRDFEYTDKCCPNFDVAQWCEARNIANPVVALPIT